MRTFLDEGTACRVFKAEKFPVDMEKITVTEWAAGIDIADQLIVGQTTFQFTDPDTTDETSWKDKGKAQSPTADNYEGSATMFRDRGSDGALTERDPLKVFKHREVLYIGVRQGRPEDVSVTAGQDYQFFRFMVSKRNPLPNPDGATEKIEIAFLAQGHAGFGEIAGTTGG